MIVLMSYLGVYVVFLLCEEEQGGQADIKTIPCLNEYSLYVHAFHSISRQRPASSCLQQVHESVSLSCCLTRQAQSGGIAA